ncbi:hypothetical protein [uncultured Thiohalocapsa sp.]|uniref:hypothetical protein n=1 Tax=uncultured Thiohalocapsa sp. TaxID=768990 RepID=UPI0025E3236D|nr:hypothetical protein [uncultured Thiohalocapsa sp.]
MTNRVRSILEQLEQTREDLLALSDDIWLSIDHNDGDALDAGVEFKRRYNAKMAELDTLASELSGLVQEFTAVKLDDAENGGAQTPQARDRVVRDLDQREPHGIDEDFTFKRPYGFRLGDNAKSDIKSWRRLFELVCFQLAAEHPERFATLPDEPRFTSSRGRPYMARDPQAVRMPVALPSGVYAEAHMSANGLRDQIRALLDTFGIDHGTLRIYLRQDRDAEANLT